MLEFDDETAAVDGKRSERMNFRTKPHVKESIRRAAALAGVDESAFAMSAAYREALETIALHERTQLEASDHAAFFTALDNPGEPTDALRAALQRHQRTVIPE